MGWDATNIFLQWDGMGRTFFDNGMGWDEGSKQWDGMGWDETFGQWDGTGWDEKSFWDGTIPGPSH